MSRAGVQQRVLRAVRLLSDAVKIGIDEAAETNERAASVEPIEPAESDISVKNKNQDRAVAESKAETRESARTDSPAKPKTDADTHDSAASRAANKKLLAQLEEQVKSLRAELEASKSEITARDSELAKVTAERDKLAGEIDGVKADYTSRKKALEDDAAAQAKKVADEAREAATKEGWTSGHTDGLKTARFEIEKEYHDKLSGLLKILGSINTNLNENFAKLVDLNQPRLLRLWSVMLHKMLNRNIELDPTAVNQVLQNVLTQVNDRNQITIYVAPQDLTSLQGKDGELDDKVRDMLRGARHLELKPDTNIDPGSCVVETSLGVYDARWRTQFEQIDMVLDKIFQELKTVQDGEES